MSVFDLSAESCSHSPARQAFDDDGAIPAPSDEEDPGDQEHDPDRPTTKEEVQQLRERFGNNRRTASYFYSQKWVQLEMRMIYLGARAVAHEFSETIKLLQQGQVTCHQAFRVLQA